MLEQTSCFTCGIYFGLESKFASELKESHQIFYCPNGHKLIFRETDLQKEERSFKEQIKLVNEELKHSNEELNIILEKLDEKDKLIADLQSELEQFKPAH